VKSISDKISGLKQEIEGKMKHDPNLVEHGRDKRTGLLKLKELRAVNIFSPLLNAFLV
jgi:hypothetical protein